MYLEAQSMLSVHHAEHRERIAARRAPAPRPMRLVPASVRAAYVAALRAAYVRARAAHAASSLPA